MSSSRKCKLFFIGYNGTGESGLGHTNKLKQLTLCPNEIITCVYPSNLYSRYTDDTLQNLWSAGRNTRGYCCIPNEAFTSGLPLTPIHYFKIHNIKIKKVL